MTSTFFANTNSKIRKLKVDKSYPVFPNSGLSVIKRGKSTYFQGRMRSVSYTHLTLPTIRWV